MKIKSTLIFRLSAIGAILGAATLLSTIGMAATSQLGFFDFRVGQFTVLQKGGSSYAAFGSWNPSIPLIANLGLRFEAGVGTAKSSSDDGGVLLIATSKGMFSFGFSETFGLEFGTGYQKWFGAGDIGVLTATVGIMKGFGGSKIWFFKGIALDYTMAFVSNNRTHEIQAGLIF